MVYVTGDMHGDFERFKLPAMKKLKKGDTLIICGDFGFLWDGSKEEEKILEKLSEKKFNICFKRFVSSERPLIYVTEDEDDD